MLRRTTGGFARGALSMEGSGAWAGRTLRIEFQNENLLAYEGPGERLLATVPDLICCVEAESEQQLSDSRVAARRGAAAGLAQQRAQPPAGVKVQHAACGQRINIILGSHTGWLIPYACGVFFLLSIPTSPFFALIPPPCCLLSLQTGSPLPQKNSGLGCGWRYWAFRLTPCSPPQQHWRWLGLRRLDTAKCGTHSWRSTSSPSPFQALRGRWVAQCDGSFESCSRCSCCGSCLHASQLPVSQPVCLSQESVCEHVSVCARERNVV